MKQLDDVPISRTVIKFFIKKSASPVARRLLLIGITLVAFFPTVNAQTSKLKDDVYVVVEEQPVFPGGRDSLMIYVKEQVRYPETAVRAKIKGKVYVTFIVEKDGGVSSIEVLNGLGYGCDEEAIRVVQQMPRWEPGKQSGRPLRVKYTVPVSFGLK